MSRQMPCACAAFGDMGVNLPDPWYSGHQRTPLASLGGWLTPGALDGSIAHDYKKFIGCGWSLECIWSIFRAGIIV